MGRERFLSGPLLEPGDKALPEPEDLERAVAWGRESMAQELPRLQKLFERVKWVEPKVPGRKK